MAEGFTELKSLESAEALVELNRMFRELYDTSAGDNETVRVYSGFGTPEGSVSAGIGSIYLRKDGGTGTTIYKKESGTGATGWVAIALPTSKCRAYLTTANQAIDSSTWTKVLLNAESYDVNGEFASNKFTVTVAGYYLISVKAYFSTITDAKTTAVGFKIDADLASYDYIVSGATGDVSHELSDVRYLNVGNYIEMWVWHQDVAARSIVLGESLTYMAIAQLA